VAEKQYVLPMPSKRGVLFFLVANVLAFALCGAVWALVWYGDFFSPAAAAVWAFLAEHSGWTSARRFPPCSPRWCSVRLHAPGNGAPGREKAQELAEAAKVAGTQLPA